MARVGSIQLSYSVIESILNLPHGSVTGVINEPRTRTIEILIAHDSLQEHPDGAEVIRIASLLNMPDVLSARLLEPGQSNAPL